MAYNEGYNVGWDIAGPQQEQLVFEAQPTGQSSGGGGGGFNMQGLGGILDLFNKSNNTSGGTTGQANSGFGSMFGGQSGSSSGLGGMMGSGSSSGLGGMLSKILGMFGQGSSQESQPVMPAQRVRNTGTATPSDLWGYQRNTSNNMDLGTMLALMQLNRGGI